jgi:hypothetical protein
MAKRKNKIKICIKSSKNVYTESKQKRKLIRLRESREQKLLSRINSLKPLFVKAAQDQYDSWDQDETGYDQELGYGGICHLIADDIVDIIDEHIPNALSTTISADHEQHVYTAVAHKSDDEWECYMIDIHHGYYETGGGFRWTKLPDVEFDESMISTYPVNVEDMFDEEAIEWYLDET